jgi:hypothetical protein
LLRDVTVTGEGFGIRTTGEVRGFDERRRQGPLLTEIHKSLLNDIK